MSRVKPLTLLCYFGLIATSFTVPPGDAAEDLSRPDQLAADAAMSTALEPVTFGPENFEIPHNYLLAPQSRPDGLVNIVLTWPDLQPRTPETRACFENRIDCAKQWFSLEPGSFDPDVRLSNILKTDLNWRRVEGKFGYNVYQVGPADARSELHTKHSGDSPIIIFECYLTKDSDNSAEICSGDFTLKESVHLHLIFRYDQIPNIEAAIGKFRPMLDEFQK